MKFLAEIHVIVGMDRDPIVRHWHHVPRVDDVLQLTEGGEIIRGVVTQVVWFDAEQLIYVYARPA